MSKPKEFWILNEPENPYPTCYRGQPTWGCEPDDTGAVLHVREVTPLTEAAPDLLHELKLANKIIMNALNVMTSEQKLALDELNYRDDLKDGFAMTRNGAREAVIRKAEGVEE